MTDFLSKYSSRKFIIAITGMVLFYLAGDLDKVFWVAGIYLGAQGITDAVEAY